MLKRFLLVVLVSSAVYFFSWLGVFTSGVNNLSVQSEDTLPAMFLPYSIINEHTLFLDKYYPEILKKYPHPDDKKFLLGLTPFYVRLAGGHVLSAFPVVTAFLAVPVYYTALIFGVQDNWTNTVYLAHLASAVIVSLSAGFLYVLLRSKFLDDKKALLLTAIYAFGTINYALVSQALWQHGSVELLLILSLIFLYKAKSNSTNIRYLYLALFGFFLGFCIMSRFTAAVFLPFLGIVALEGMANFKLKVKSLFSIAVGIVPSALFFLWYNSKFYLSIQNQGYADQVASNWLGRFPEGFLGLWLSPSKGILVYSPVFLFLFISVYLLAKKQTGQRLQYAIFLTIAVVYTLIMGKWKHWYGGWSFGYRMAADVIPFLCLSLVPFLNSAYFTKLKKLIFLAVFVSLGMQLMGIVFFDGIWHGTYDLGFRNTSWLWSVQNSELAFNLRRIVGKIL